MSVWRSEKERLVSWVSCYQRELAALESLGEIDDIGSYSLNGFSNVMSISPANGVNARDLALQIIARLRAQGQMPPIATKHLEASTGKITYTLPGPIPGWTMEISGGDPRCKVVPVTKFRTVPAKPAVAAVEAHEEPYTEYVIENPEECGAAGGE